jgi:hypothetical protein
VSGRAGFESGVHHRVLLGLRVGELGGFQGEHEVLLVFGLEGAVLEFLLEVKGEGIWGWKIK